ncbi:MAG: hypothetical protein LUD48_00230 [Prevotella sp.]|nr:hypothetical protein [Prevotella sp.]
MDEIKGGKYRVVTNSDIAQLRREYPECANNTVMINVLENGVGYNSVIEAIDKAKANVGETKVSQNMTVNEYIASLTNLTPEEQAKLL